MRRWVDLDMLLVSINAVFDSKTAKKVCEYLRSYIAVEEEEIWISVDDRLPEREEWMGTKGEEHYLRRMEIAVMSDTLEYFLAFYDGYKWFDKFGRTYTGVKAWKIHEPFNLEN